MAVADYYKLFRGADGFDLDSKKLVNEGLLIPRKHIEKINRQYKSCGKYYVIDEDATNAAFEQGKENVKAIREAEENKAELGKVMADTLKAVKKGAVKKDKTPDTNEELDAAFEEYFEVFGEHAHPRSGLKGLNEKIAVKREELNNN